MLPRYLFAGCLVIVLNLMMTAVTWAAAPFLVSYLSNTGYTNNQGTPLLFNMVPGSTQQLKFNIASSDQNTKIISCNITSSAYDSVGALGGCTNQNGAGTPYPLVFTITAGNTPGTVTHTLTIQTLSGRQVVKIPINYTIVNDSSRKITFKNYCKYDVYFGIATGTLGGSCTTTADCPGGTSGGTQCSGGQCFWIPPTPKSGSGQNTYLLTGYTGGTPSSNSISIPDKSAANGSTKVWSGGFGGRTGCTFTGSVISCATADCGDDGSGSGACALGTGFTAPATQVEPTFIVKTPDSYDVTIINGFNVPMSFTPDNISAGASSPYDCGSPGGASNVTYADVLYSTANPSPSGTLSASPWSFTPPSNNLRYQWVSATPGTPCTTNGDCGSNSCGLTTTNVNGNSAALTCGKLLGYWTQDEICAKNSSFSQASIVDCTATNSITTCTGDSKTCPVTVPANTYHFVNLLACTTAPPNTKDDKLTFASCFAKGAYSSVNCCGCTNWQSTSGFTGQVPSDSSIVPQCSSSAANMTPNTNWVNNVLGNLTWLKNACTSCYTYPYDDKTSGFSCPYAYEGGQSAVNYTVTFCPGQEQGGIT